jgi:hypothetical protein
VSVSAGPATTDIWLAALIVDHARFAVRHPLVGMVTVDRSG